MTERPAWWTTDEWATPPEIVTEMEAEFGPFDLDPCARPETTKAAYYYAKDIDGLTQEWFGRVWLNPPYSEPSKWMKKTVEELQAGRVSLVVALLPTAVDTGWFHDFVLPYAEVRYRRGRIKFLGWEGLPIGSPTAGSLFAIYRSTP